MPEAVAAAVASWASGATVTGFAAAGATGVSAISVGLGTAAIYAGAYITTTVVIGAGLGALGRAVAPKLNSGSLSSGSPLQMGRDPVAQRRVIYGQTRVGGPMVYVQATGTKNEYIHLVECLAGHECEEIGDIYFADEVVPLDGSGNATGTFVGLARVVKHLGTDAQTADANLVAESSGLWTADHRLRGIANIVARLKWDQTKFPGGLPNITAVVKGRKCYDPRDTVTRWTQNPALCIRDYLTNTTFGMAVDAATEIDDASFIAAANVCDEAVALAAGGTEKRYTVNGSFELSAEPATVLERLAAAMAGMIVYVGGKWMCNAGTHETPTIELNENDLRGPISVQTKLSMRDTCNRVKGTFVSPDEKWQPTDFTPIVNATYLAEDGGTEIWRDLELRFTSSQATAQRLAKIELERTRQDIVVTMPCKLTALRVQAGNVVMLTNARFGWTQKQFIVTGLKFAAYETDGTLALGVDLELRETASAVWDWNSGEETTFDPAPNTSLKDARVVAAPTSLVLSSSGQGLLQPDGTYVPRMKLAWAAPDDQAVQSGGLIRIQYKTTAAPAWSEWGTVLGAQTFDFITDVLIGTGYDVRIRAENNFGAESAWVTPAAGSHTVVGDTTGPSDPGGLSVTARAGYNEVKWSPSASADISENKIWRHTSNNPGAATEIGENDGTFWNDATAVAGAPYWYWVQPIDGSENPGNKVLAGNVTTLDAPVGDTQPADPTAATKTAEGTYLAGDGQVLSYLEFSVPALPSGAQWQNLEFRRNVSGEYMVAAQLKNTVGAVTVRIDDLTPGVAYQVATRAWAPGKRSNLVAATSSPFTAPNKTGGPATPTGGVLHSDGVTPKFITGTSVLLFGTVVGWDPNTESDFSHYEVKATLTDSDGATDYSWTEYDQVNYFARPRVPNTILYNSSNVGGYVRVRAINRSGVASGWLRIGNANSASSVGAGNMAAQNSNNVQTTGIKTGGGATNKVLVRQSYIAGISLAGGSPSETYNLGLSGWGFSTAPDVGNFQAANTSSCEVRYDWDDSNSSTAVLRIRTLDGSNLPTFLIICGELIEYF